jgi:hypothetical protein
MAEMFMMRVLTACPSPVHRSKTAICAGGAVTRELNFERQDPLPAVWSCAPPPAYAHPTMICAWVARGSEDWDVGL